MLLQSVTSLLSQTSQALKRARTRFRGGNENKSPVVDHQELQCEQEDQTQSREIKPEPNQLEFDPSQISYARHDNSLREARSFADRRRTRSEQISSWKLGRYGANIHDSLVHLVVTDRDFQGKSLDASRPSAPPVNGYKALMSCQLHAQILKGYKAAEEEKIARREALTGDLNDSSSDVLEAPAVTYRSFGEPELLRIDDWGLIDSKLPVAEPVTEMENATLDERIEGDSVDNEKENAMLRNLFTDRPDHRAA